ncbi:unnamed protein product [Rotaria sp. Silwood2]|nr:unnamed protein product [Rotaria sp. Silwood2]CAF4068331.1 unnamed protein product [Rotaria sp. Silwood2]
MNESFSFNNQLRPADLNYKKIPDPYSTMTSQKLTYDDCCLLPNICLNSERISYLLECRFKSNSIGASFDFKSILPEKPSNNAKISRSFLKVCPKKVNPINNNDECISSESSEDEIDQISLPKTPINAANDDYLNSLAEWEPNNFQPIIESDDEEEEEIEMRIDIQTVDNDNTHVEYMDLSTMSTSQAEDVLITFIDRSIKSEPMIYDNNNDFSCSQLDGQTDFLSDNNHQVEKQKNEKKNLDQIIAKIKSNISKSTQTIELNNASQKFDTYQTNHNKKKKTSNQSHQQNNKSSTNKFTSQLSLSLLESNEKVIYPFAKRNRILSNNQIIDENVYSQYKHNQKVSSSIKQKSIEKNMKLVQAILNNYQKPKSIDSNPDFIQQKKLPINITKVSKSRNLSVVKNTTKTKRLNVKLNHKSQTETRSASKSKDKLLKEHTGKTLLDYYKVIEHSSENNNIQCFPVVKQQINRMKSSINKTKERPTNYFDGCIVIDDDDDEKKKTKKKKEKKKKKNDVKDDDIQLIEEQRYSIHNNIHTREKLLDHTVDSSEMRIKWLVNLELVLLEHIWVCHQENIQPKNEFYLNNCIKYECVNNVLSYDIDASFISIIILNFLKMFIIRNLNYDQDELSFFQYGLTSHLRYLLIELPTYNHKNNNHKKCLQCYQYSSIINILFDVLFDLIEYDLCEIYNKKIYRSTLIQDDYFNQFLQQKKIIKKNKFYHIKLVIYFIELIEIHRNKCQNKKEFFHINENEIFQSIENFLQHIILKINNSNNERISICFNIMELCLLFVNKKEKRIKQMALFLAKLCQEHPTYLHRFLFDENLLSDIRLLLINELIWKKFNIKFISIDSIEEVFDHIETALRLRNPIDDVALLLIRSLFSTYADLISNIKCVYMNSLTEQIISTLRNRLRLIYLTLTDIYNASNYTQQIKRTVILFRLLQSKWNRF